MKNHFDELATIKSAGPGLKWLLCVVCGLLSSVSIHAQTNLVVNGGFETGDLTGWTPSSVDDVEVDTAGYRVVHSGAYGVLFQTGVYFAYISQTLPTIPGRSYLISAWVNGIYGPWEFPFNEFHVSWNGTNLFDAANLDADWTNVQFTAVASSQHTVLQFGFRDTGTPLGGDLGLDDVSVVLIPSPEFLPGGLTVINGNLVLTWGSLPGLAYQLQYTTSLPAATWIDLGQPVTATDLTTTALDPIGSDSRRFYRVVMLP